MNSHIVGQDVCELPDLPALESVQTRGQSPIWLLVLGYGGFALIIGIIIGILLWKYREFIPRQTYFAAGLLFALLLWLVIRVLTGYTFFSTDGNGLTMRGPLLRRFIPWTEIREARSKTRDGRTTLTFGTARGRVSITPSVLGVSEGECVVASVWQHLRRLDKADGIVLNEQVLQLWQPIPDDVPHELDWGEPPRKSALVGGLIAAALYPAFVAAMVILDRRISLMYSPVFLAFGAAFYRSMLTPHLRRTARQVSIRTDGIQATLVMGKAYIPWSSVTAAWWQSTSDTGYLCIRSEVPTSEIWLPYSLGKKESEQLILSCMRYLRESSSAPAVPMPALVSFDPDFLKQTALSGQRLGYLQRAFLNTLEPAVAKRIRRLQGLPVLGILAGMLGGVAAGFANVTGIISERIFSAHGTMFFIPSSSLAIAIPLMFGGAGVSGHAAECLGYRLAGPHREVWREFCKIGSGNGKLGKVLLWVCITLLGLSVLSLPLFVCCYARVTGSGIAINRPLRFHEQFYTWRQIERIELRHSSHLDHGRTHANQTYIIRFTDCTDWKPSDEGLAWERERTARAIAFIRRTSGRPLMERWGQ